MNLIADALQVSTGERAPTRPAAAYRDAAARWAEACADENESPTVALARLCANGSPIVGACYRAAAIASLLDDLDADELLPADAPDTSARRAAWADFLRLVEPHALPDEPLPTTLRRVLGDNLAARALLLLLLQEPNQ